MSKQCVDCRDGEHDNYDDDVRVTIVREPGKGKWVKRGYMCRLHREMYAEDGYDVTAK